MKQLLNNYWQPGSKARLPLAQCCFLFLFYFVVLLSSCRNNNSPQIFRNYDLASFKKIVLSNRMDEISGLAYSAPANEIFAVNDEEGKLFVLDAATGKVKRFVPFGSKADYEDLVLVDSTIWVLVSNGNLVQLTGYQTTQPTAKEISFPFKKGYEFETAFADSSGQWITLVCKLCEGKHKGALQLFSLNTTTGVFDSSKTTLLDFSGIKSFGKKTTFRASAAAMNPADGNLYIISSIDKMIFAATPQGKMLGGYKIDAAVFKQPEGICFSPNGTMYISNEAAGGNANLLVFDYKKPKQ
jgi:uncharacterized protein YjiK